MLNLDTPWAQGTFVAFDLETSGKYPLEAEICEMAAVKWSQGQEVGRWSSLIRPSRPMSPEVIAIHKITNEMVAQAPSLKEKLPEFLDFLGEAIGVAHHAPFDMGFLMADIERFNLTHPPGPVLCTSLLSRQLIPESGNHRLSTLSRFLGLPQGQGHRALYDAETCWGVALQCLGRLGEEASLAQVFRAQGGPLHWSNYSLKVLGLRPEMDLLVQAIRQGREVDLVYSGGSRPGQARRVRPLGLVRNPRGDFVVAVESGQDQSKRYLLDKILEVSFPLSR